MILLDTNIISEVMKAAPDPSVVVWLNSQASNKLHLSSISIGEIAYGIRILPAGKRRSELHARFESFVKRAFDQRVLSYDEAAARTYGEIMGKRRELGRPTSVPGGQIAAIARSRSLAVATRNLNDFEHCGVELINPFDTPSD